MSIEKIGFKASPLTKPQSDVSQKDEIKPQEIDEEKSNAAKYMIGATALAGIVTLGILGYHGKLGKGIQKLLGNSEKAADKAADNLSNVKNPETKTPIIEPKDTTSPSINKNEVLPPKPAEHEIKPGLPKPNEAEKNIHVETSNIETKADVEIKQPASPKPAEPEIKPEPPKPNPSEIGAPHDGLKGKALLDENFKEMAKREGDELEWLCINTQKELKNLDSSKRIEYMQKYLDNLKVVDIKKFNMKNEIFSGLFDFGFDNEKSAEMIIKFAKENEAYQPATIHGIISSVNNMYFQARGAEIRPSLANIFEMLKKSGLKNKPKAEYPGLRQYADNWAEYLSDFENPDEVDKLTKYFYLKCKNLDLALGMDEFQIKRTLKILEEYPDYFKKVLNITKENGSKEKFIQELKESYKQLTGNEIDLSALGN